MTDVLGVAWQERVVKGASHFGVTVSGKTSKALSLYARELLAWNAKCNLTAIIDPMEVAEKHMVDALAVVPHIPAESRLLDIGTGGGFPGIPASLMDETLSVTLVDAVRKKVSFLKHVARALKLPQVEAIHARAELLSKEEGRGKGYDVVTSRAFSSIDAFVKMALPFVKPQGRIIAMKGSALKEDETVLTACLKELEAEGVHFSVEVIPYTLPFSGSGRSLFVLTLHSH